MMKECCNQDGMPDFEKIKTFMERRGKTEFSENEIRMMREFCDPTGKPDAEQIKQFMAKCGC